jgi:hypothetical protein
MHRTDCRDLIGCGGSARAVSRRQSSFTADVGVKFRNVRPRHYFEELSRCHVSPPASANGASASNLLGKDTGAAAEACSGPRRVPIALAGYRQGG